tara:strand:- start:139 stop:441 length:303 start_codon:yes stop_codon:yes gene_type:complete
MHRSAWIGASRSALTGFETALGLVDHIDAALAAHDPAITVPVLQRPERVPDFHLVSPSARRWAPLGFNLPRSGGSGRSIHGGRYWDRTSDPFDVNEVLYR